MNNDVATLLGIMWVLMAASGIFLYKSVLVIGAYLTTRRRRREYPSMVAVDPKTACKEVHTWDEIKLALAGLEPGYYKVCTTCGQIAKGGSLRKLNGPGMEVYKNQLKRRRENQAKLDAVKLKRQQMTNDIMLKMIRDHARSLDGDNANNVEVLQQFFRKSSIELESMYIELHKDIEEIERG